MAKRNAYPEFILSASKDVPAMPIQNVSKYDSVLSNWLRTHAYITKLKAEKKSLDELVRLMAIECNRTPRPRAHMLERLHGKYDRLRREVERAQLKAL